MDSSDVGAPLTTALVNVNESSVIDSTKHPTDLNEHYDYDVTESLETYDWAQLIPPVVVYSIVLLVGIFGNALIVFTIARFRRLKTITNIFLASLATADLLLVTICVPVNVAKLFSYTWTFGVFLCKFVHYMQNVSAICSVLTLTAMSIERYYAIVHPMRAQYMCTLSQARKVITGTWIASFLLASPILWIQIHLPVGERVPAYWCVRDWESPIVWQIYEIYMLVLVLVIPLSIMAYAYGVMSREIWRVTHLRSTMTNESAREPRRPTQRTQLPDVLVGPETCAVNGRTRPSAGSCYSSAGTWTSNQRAPSSSASTAVSSRAPSNDQQTARQVVKMLVAVVVLFTVCWSPYLIDNVLMSFELLPAARTGPVKHMRIAFHLLSYINSCCNPLVYGFMSKNFRRAFIAALRLGSASGRINCCCCRGSSNRTADREQHQSVNEMTRVISHQPSRFTTHVRLQDPRSATTGTAGTLMDTAGV